MIYFYCNVYNIRRVENYIHTTTWAGHTKLAKIVSLFTSLLVPSCTFLGGEHSMTGQRTYFIYYVIYSGILRNKLFVGEWRLITWFIESISLFSWQYGAALHFKDLCFYVQWLSVGAPLPDIICYCFLTTFSLSSNYIMTYNNTNTQLIANPF